MAARRGKRGIVSNWIFGRWRFDAVWLMTGGRASYSVSKDPDGVHLKAALLRAFHPVSPVLFASLSLPSYSMQQDDSTQARGASNFDITKLSVTGRKAWKTMKGKGEAVWPPHL